MTARQLHDSIPLLEIRQTDTALDVWAELMRVLPRCEIGRDGDGEGIGASDESTDWDEELDEAGGCWTGKEGC